MEDYYVLCIITSQEIIISVTNFGSFTATLSHQVSETTVDPISLRAAGNVDIPQTILCSITLCILHKSNLFAYYW